MLTYSGSETSRPPWGYIRLQVVLGKTKKLLKQHNPTKIVKKFGKVTRNKHGVRKNERTSG